VLASDDRVGHLVRVLARGNFAQRIDCEE
jgi:hypothetical protein